MTPISYANFTSKTCRTAWLKDWAAEFLRGLAQYQEKEEIRQYCEAKKAEFEEKCQQLSATRNGSEVSWQNSAATQMSQIRNAIKQWQESVKLTEFTGYDQQTKNGLVQQHLALLYMHYPSDFHTQRKAPTEAKKQAQRRNLETINSVDEYQVKIEELLQSPDHKEVTVGLIAATGRRPSEILKTAQFNQVGQFEVKFSGQLKTKGEERDPYPVFTLVESAKVVNALARLRRMPEIKELKSKTLAEIDSGRNSGVNRVVKEHFSSLINPPVGELELSSKNLRASYAAIAIYFFCPWKQSPNQFITERLGHVSDATATNYEDYQVCDKDGKPLTRGAWVVKISEEVQKATEAHVMNVRIRMSEATKIVIDDQEFLPFPDQVSRLEELVRLAKIGKQFEEGKIVKEVIVVTHPSSITEVEEAKEGCQDKEIEQTTIAEKVASSSKAKEPELLTNSELFGSKAPNTGAEKIRRAVEAIKEYNNRQGESAMKWAITTTVLKDLTNCRTEVVKAYMESPEGGNNYNQMMGFTYHHNRGKGSIKDFIKLI